MSGGQTAITRRMRTVIARINEARACGVFDGQTRMELISDVMCGRVEEAAEAVDMFWSAMIAFEREQV